MTRAAAILVAAGRGSRMGGDKLWIDLWGRPAWRWSLDALLAVPELAPIAVVIPGWDAARFAAALQKPMLDRCLLVAGGGERRDSVLAGLDALVQAGLHGDAVVLVHDAARPAASPELVRRVLEAAANSGAAVPSVAVPDTLRQTAVAEGGVAAGEVVEREGLVAAQTPQAGRIGELRDALQRAREAGELPTDDAAALVAAGGEVVVVEGEPTNLKLTEPGDEELLRAVLRARALPVSPAPAESAASASMRTGIGFDAHRLDAARPMRLGGLDWVDAPAGLAGHSDGDVALHAVVDALLGAAGLGDIGTLFPSDDPRWAGADSAAFVAEAVVRLEAEGWRPASVDLVVVAASPRIGGRRHELTARIGELLGIGAPAVSVKATTSDGLGFGGEEGIAAYAVAVLEPTGQR